MALDGIKALTFDVFGTGVKDDLPAEHGLDLVAEDFVELAERLGC